MIDLNVFRDEVKKAVFAMDDCETKESLNLRLFSLSFARVYRLNGKVEFEMRGIKEDFNLFGLDFDEVMRRSLVG